MSSKWCRVRTVTPVASASSPTRKRRTSTRQTLRPHATSGATAAASWTPSPWVGRPAADDARREWQAGGHGVVAEADRDGAAGRRAARHRAARARAEPGVPEPDGRHDPAPGGRRVVAADGVPRRDEPAPGDDPVPGDPRRQATAGDAGPTRDPGGDGASGGESSQTEKYRVRTGGAQRRHRLRHVVRG